MSVALPFGSSTFILRTRTSDAIQPPTLQVSKGYDLSGNADETGSRQTAHCPVVGISFHCLLQQRRLLYLHPLGRLSLKMLSLIVLLPLLDVASAGVTRWPPGHGWGPGHGGHAGHGQPIAITVDLGYSKCQGTNLEGVGVNQYRTSSLKFQNISDANTSTVGMRFAPPPLGDLRFRAPRDPEHTNGVQPATEFQATCLGSYVGLCLENPQENCLFINVFTPSNATTTSKLPVWVRYIKFAG